jgi:hypothetical protein
MLFTFKFAAHPFAAIISPVPAGMDKADKIKYTHKKQGTGDAYGD